MLRLVALVAAAALSVAAVALASAKMGIVRVHAELQPSVGLPRPTDAAHAAGSFTATFPRSAPRPRFLWTIVFFDLTGPAASADLHVGPSDSAGGELFPLCRPCKTGQSGSTNLTRRGIRLIESGRLYVVVRTTTNPRGEIRGRLLIRR
jgi:hypothetical protein